MHCSKAARQLQLYIDNQLTFAQIRALEAHLADCPSCRKDLSLLMDIASALHDVDPVVEPADLTENVMRRIALLQEQSTTQTSSVSARETWIPEERQKERQKEPFFSFRPSLPEILVAAVLATLTLFMLVNGQTAVHSLLDIYILASAHNPLVLSLHEFWNTLMSVNSDTLMLCIWVLGTALGVWITLIVAGADMRNQWFKAVMDRLPVHL